MGRDQFDLIVEFAAATQSLGALQAAAYRLIGTATCQIDQTSDRWVCRLAPIESRKSKPPSSDALKNQFMDLVTDENLRERVAERTSDIRNVILALAFGSLANSSETHHQ